LWLVVIATILLAIIAFAMLVHEGDCHAHEHPVWVFDLMCPLVLLRVFVELKALRYILKPYLASSRKAGLRPFKFGPFPVPFSLWFMAELSISMADLASMVTRTLFYGSNMAIVSCQTNMLRSRWDSLRDEDSGAVVGFEQALMLAWICNFCPLVLCTGAVRWNVTQLDSGDAIGMNWMYGRVHTGDVVLSLARVSGMSTIKQIEMSYRIARAKMYLQSEEPSKAISLVLGETSRMILRVIFVLLLDACVQVYVISYIFIMKENIIPGRAEFELTGPLIPLCMSFSLLVVKLMEFRRYASLVDMVCCHIPEIYLDQAHHTGGTMRDAIAKIMFRKRVILSACTLMLLFLLYWGVKMVGVFYCKTSVFSFQQLGCMGLRDPAE
jgi:hypothetical protein